MRGLALVLGLAAATVHAAAIDGRDLVLRADKGNCLACHMLPEGAGPSTRANVGPRLDAATLAAWDRTRLRALLHDPSSANAETIMPPYGKHRILTDEEIGAIVEFLLATR